MALYAFLLLQPGVPTKLFIHGLKQYSKFKVELETSESLRAAKAVDGYVVGVDFIPAKNREKDKPFFIEVNSNPGLSGIEKTFSKNFSITQEILKTYMNRENWTQEKI